MPITELCLLGWIVSLQNRRFSWTRLSTCFVRVHLKFRHYNHCKYQSLLFQDVSLFCSSHILCSGQNCPSIYALGSIWQKCKLFFRLISWSIHYKICILSIFLVYFFKIVFYFLLHNALINLTMIYVIIWTVNHIVFDF